MLRKISALLLSLVILLCGTALAEVTPNGEFPVVDTPTEITIWTSIPGTQTDYTNNATTKYYEEKTGVHVNWIEVADAEKATLFNTSLASASYPDYYMTGVNSTDLISYYEDGVIIPLNDLIDQYSVYLKQLLDENPSVREAITAPDGNIYSFPMVNYIPAQNVDAKIYVYKEWLQKYTEETGKAKPNTAEGLEEMLLYFRDHDMNGNGDPSDEVPLAFYANNTDRFLRWVSNFYQVTPNEHYRVDVDGSGEVVACFTTEEYKMALEYAHSLYAEGLILQDSFSISVDDLRAIGEAPAGETLGLIIGWGPEEGVVKAGDTNRWFDYFVLAPVEGENGQRHTIYNANYPCQGGWFITDKCPAEYVQYAVRLGDLFLDEYYGYSAYLGVKGVAWDDPSSEEALGINGEQAWFRELVNYGTQPVNSSWDQKAPSNRYAQFRLSQEADGAPEIMEYCDGNLALKETVVPLSSYNEVMKYYGCQKNLEKYAFGAEWCVPALLYDPSIADQANDSETAINEYRKEMAVAFITGTRSLDEYDAYVEELYTMGLQLVLDAKNDAYSVLK